MTGRVIPVDDRKNPSFREGKIKTTVWLEPDVYNWAKDQCAIRRLTMSVFIGARLRAARKKLTEGERETS